MGKQLKDWTDQTSDDPLINQAGLFQKRLDAVMNDCRIARRENNNTILYRLLEEWHIMIVPFIKTENGEKDSMMLRRKCKNPQTKTGFAGKNNLVYDSEILFQWELLLMKLSQESGLVMPYKDNDAWNALE